MACHSGTRTKLAFIENGPAGKDGRGGSAIVKPPPIRKQYRSKPIGEVIVCPAAQDIRRDGSSPPCCWPAPDVAAVPAARLLSEFQIEPLPDANESRLFNTANAHLSTPSHSFKRRRRAVPDRSLLSGRTSNASLIGCEHTKPRAMQRSRRREMIFVGLWVGCRDQISLKPGSLIVQPHCSRQRWPRVPQGH